MLCGVSFRIHGIQASPVACDGRLPRVGGGGVVPPAARSRRALTHPGRWGGGDLTSRVLAAGNPAKVVKQLKIPDGWRRERACPAAARRPWRGHVGDYPVDELRRGPIGGFPCGYVTTGGKMIAFV